MTFFLDENIPKSAVHLLKNRGFEVIDIRGTDKVGIDDVAIFEMAQQAGAIFLTTDKDFFHTIPHYFDKNFGVVVITLKKPDRSNILKKLT